MTATCKRKVLLLSSAMSDVIAPEIDNIKIADSMVFNLMPGGSIIIHNL